MSTVCKPQKNTICFLVHVQCVCADTLFFASWVLNTYQVVVSLHLGLMVITTWIVAYTTQMNIVNNMKCLAWRAIFCILHYSLNNSLLSFTIKEMLTDSIALRCVRLRAASGSRGLIRWDESSPQTQFLPQRWSVVGFSCAASSVRGGGTQEFEFRNHCGPIKAPC